MFLLRRFPTVVSCAALAALCASVPLQAQQEPPADAPLTLDVARDLAWHNHGDVAAAREDIDAAQNRITSAKSARAPQVTGTVSSNYENGQVVTAPVSQNLTTSTVSTGVALSQNIFDSGKIKYSVRGARAASISSDAGLGTARNSLAYEVAQNFFEQLRQEQLIEQRKKQIEVAQGQLDQIQAQIDAGASPASDITGARVTLAQAQFDLVTAQTDQRTAAAKLRNSLGLDRGPALKIVAPTAEQETPPNLDEAQQIAASQRPDLISGRASVAQSKASLQSVKIEERPQVAANLGYNLDPRATDNHRLQVAATLSLPIFNGKGRRADTQAARDDLQAAQIRLGQLQKDAASDVETALLSVNGQQNRVESARALVESAQTNLDAATGKYQAGAGIALDVTSAQSQLFQAQTSLTNAEFDLRVARENLSRALGYFAWENGVAPVVPTELIEGTTATNPPPVTATAQPIVAPNTTPPAG